MTGKEEGDVLLLKKVVKIYEANGNVTKVATLPSEGEIAVHITISVKDN